MARRGVFVTVEGIDGTGKSTQIRLLAQKLAEKGREVLTTREPGGSPGAEEIRNLLVQGPPGRWSPETELLLFTAARRDHLERTILPALDRGAIVLCDRFIDSTRAYQGIGFLRSVVESLYLLMIRRDPDLTLILDMAPEDALARTSNRDSDGDRFEQRGLEFQRYLRTAYQEIAADEPRRVRLIDASGATEEVTERLLAAVRPVIKRIGARGATDE